MKSAFAYCSHDFSRAGDTASDMFEDASAALEIMAVEPADILLSDVSMAEHDGLWLAQQVHAGWPQTAVAMSTADDDALTVRASRRMGAVA
jgi:DNA-binding NtrC family response regulator